MSQGTGWSAALSAAYIIVLMIAGTVINDRLRDIEKTLQARLAAEAAEKMTLCRAYWQWSGGTREKVEGMEAYCR